METASASIDSFVDRLVDEKGLLGLDDEVLTQVKSDLTSRVEDKINAVILANMPDSKLEEFSQVLETGTPETIQAFCASTVPNLENIVAQALLSFRDTYVAG